VANDVMQRFEERAAKAHAESVERGEHDDQCEYQAIKGWYLCNCSKRARLKRGLTTPPELEHQYPICLGCNEEVNHDGDGWNCPRCSTSWNSRNEGHFYDEFGDLHTEIAEIREQQAAAAGEVVPVPNGCRWCGIEKHGHDQRHAPFVKWHGWTEPTNKQRLTRMKARRAAKVQLPEPAEVTS
jgi:hypothetical protein